MFTISQAAIQIGVSPVTLRRWDRNGRLRPIRTLGGHRRYSFAQLAENGWVTVQQSMNPSPKTTKHTYLYARVSSYRQQTDGNLDRQVQGLEAYYRRHFGKKKPYVIIKEYGSGLNCQRRGLWRLIKAIKAHKVDRLLIAYKDRLTRFGFDFLVEICHLFDVPIIEVALPSDQGIEQQLVTDMMSLIASFSGKLYQLRALKARGYSQEDRETKKIVEFIQKWIAQALHTTKVLCIEQIYCQKIEVE